MGFTWEPTQCGVLNDPSPSTSTFRENVSIKAKKYLICKLPKTDGAGGGGGGSKGIRNPLTLSSTFFPHGCSSSSSVRLSFVSKAVIKAR